MSRRRWLVAAGLIVLGIAIASAWFFIANRTRFVGTWTSADGRVIVRVLAAEPHQPDDPQFEGLRKSLGGYRYPRAEIDALAATGGEIAATLELRADSVAVFRLSVPRSPPIPVAELMSVWEAKGDSVHLFAMFANSPALSEILVLEGDRLVGSTNASKEQIVFERSAPP